MCIIKYLLAQQCFWIFLKITGIVCEIGVLFCRICVGKSRVGAFHKTFHNISTPLRINSRKPKIKYQEDLPKCRKQEGYSPKLAINKWNLCQQCHLVHLKEGGEIKKRLVKSSTMRLF